MIHKDIPQPEKFEPTNYKELNSNALGDWLKSKHHKQCPYCLGTGYTAQPNGPDDFDLEVCEHTK